jgi:hypothetical protein
MSSVAPLNVVRLLLEAAEEPRPCPLPPLLPRPLPPRPPRVLRPASVPALVIELVTESATVLMLVNDLPDVIRRTPGIHPVVCAEVYLKWRYFAGNRRHTFFVLVPRSCPVGGFLYCVRDSHSVSFPDAVHLFRCAASRRF